MISYKPYVGPEAFRYREGFSVLYNMSMLESVVLTHAWSPIIWRDGKALGTNFLSSDFLALDFDSPGDETMREVNHALQDHQRIIAPTKSSSEKNERYRLIIPWERQITDAKTYVYNIRLALARFPWADRNCADSARFYFPSKEIFVCDRLGEYRWEVKEPSQETTKIKNQTFVPRFIPAWALAFINRGLIYHESRNMTIFYVAIELAKRGFSPLEVENLIKRAPISWAGTNLRASIQSAFKKKDTPT